MTEPADKPHPPAVDADRFRAAAKQDQPGIVREFFGFLVDNKKWWLLPIALALLVLGGLALFAGSGAAPFIYTLF